MNLQEADKALETFEGDLRGILGRFVETKDAIHIRREDHSRLHQLVIELRDFLKDALGPENEYSAPIANYYAEGVNNFYGSPSYRCVENLIAVVASVRTRITRNPALLEWNTKPATESTRGPEPAPALAPPEAVTLGWLFKHVPVRLWLSFLGLIVAVFVAGVQASRLSLVQEFFELEAKQGPVVEEKKSVEEPNKAMQPTPQSGAADG
jgi:hypothetical protein